MRRFILFILAGMLILCRESFPCAGQEIEVMDQMKLEFETDGSLFIVSLSTDNPDCIMRMVMQNVTVYIDPTHREKTKYSIEMPSGVEYAVKMAQQRNISNDMPESGSGDEQRQRPDILPLVSELNNVGADYWVSGRCTHLDSAAFRVFIDTDSDRLCYRAVVPFSPFLSEKKLKTVWHAGIYAHAPESSEAVMPPGPPGERPASGDTPPQGPPPMSGDHLEWIEFNIDDLLNSNR